MKSNGENFYYNFKFVSAAYLNLPLIDSLNSLNSLINCDRLLKRIIALKFHPKRSFTGTFYCKSGRNHMKTNVCLDFLSWFPKLRFNWVICGYFYHYHIPIKTSDVLTSSKKFLIHAANNIFNMIAWQIKGVINISLHWTLHASSTICILISRKWVQSVNSNARMFKIPGYTKIRELYTHAHNT